MLAGSEQMSMWGYGPAYVLMEHRMEEAKDCAEMDLKVDKSDGPVFVLMANTYATAGMGQKA